MSVPTLRPYQVDTIKRSRLAFADGARSLVIVSPTGSGKCLGIGTPVLRFDGKIVPVEEIRVGDVLMGPDSRPRLVRSTTVGLGELYRITPIRGESWVCNDVHVLTLVHTTTDEVVDVDLPTYLASGKSYKHLHKQFSPSDGVDFAPAVYPLSIDPYFLGVWYGDGTKSLKGVSISKPDSEIAALAHDVARRYGMGVRETTGTGGCPTYHIHNARGRGNQLLTALRGIVGSGDDLPHAYLTASRAERQAFLAGLLDTDGHLQSGCFEIVQKSTGIADGIAFLARSLGICVTRSIKTVAGVDYTRLCLSGDFSDLPTRIPRKQASPRRQIKTATRTGFDVEPIGVGEYAGFEIDGDGRFLLGDFTVTHNTTLGGAIVAGAVAKGQPTLWLAHRSELVEQAYDRLRDFGLPVGMIAAHGSRPSNPNALVQVAMIQTLIARDHRPRARLIIYDECHHGPAGTWAAVPRHYTDAHIIGLTATPERSDGRGLGDIFERLIVAVSVKELTEAGHLVPCEIVRPGKRFRSGEIAQRPVDAYLSVAPGRQAICFSRSVAVAEAHAAEFVAAGITARVVHGKMPMEERRLYLDAFKRQKVTVLVNVNVATEGFDVPNVGCVILARSLKSISMYIQIVGRGLRPAPGKIDCILIDLPGVSHDLGHPADPLSYSLEGQGISNGKATDEAVEGASCRVCGAPTTPGEICPECGAEPSSGKPDKVMHEKLVRYEAKRREHDGQRVQTLTRWLAVSKSKGYKPGWAGAKYRAVYGDWPSSQIQALARAALDDRGAA